MRHILVLATVALVALSVNHAIAEEEAAEPVDPKYTWDLTELFPSVEAWDQARKDVLAELEKIEARRGTLGDSADDLYGI